MRAYRLLLLVALPLHAQQWSGSFGTGPFVFGAFAERTATIGNESGSSTTRSRLSATTRAGATADIERDFGRWIGVRLEAAWTRAPLSIKSTGGSSTVAIEAGTVSVTSVTMPLVLHLNRGAFRFQLIGGPAYALYDIRRRGSAGVQLFEGTRGRWGGMAGIGASWWWRPRFGVEWQASDTVTGSPFHLNEVAPTTRGVRLLRPNNGHTAIALRWKF